LQDITAIWEITKIMPRILLGFFYLVIAGFLQASAWVRGAIAWSNKEPLPA
jgi:hypothetical protein